MARSTGSSFERPTDAGRGPAARIYLDYGGFSPVDPRVVAVMRPFFEGGIGNPASVHSLGVEARASLDSARAKVARLVGGAPAGVIFTSGATEANNLAIRGLVTRSSGRHVVTSVIEHVSVVNACRDLDKRGVEITWVAVDDRGRVDPEDVARAMRPDTALVSVMAGNGEIGTIQSLREIGRIARERAVPFHVDAVNALGRIAVSVDECGIDLLTMSSNDLYGPPGAGALWIRPDVKLAPLILGAGQEHGYRSGTENLPAVVGMGVAAELARAELGAEASRLTELRDRLLEGLLAGLPGARRTGPAGAGRLPHHASLVVSTVKAESVLMEMDLRGVVASSGSACGALTGEASHVLRAIGCDRAQAEGSLCFTLGRWTTASEIDTVLDVVPPIVARLRRIAP